MSAKLFLPPSFHAGWHGNYPPVIPCRLARQLSPRHSMPVGSTTVAWNLLGMPQDHCRAAPAYTIGVHVDN